MALVRVAGSKPLSISRMTLSPITTLTPLPDEAISIKPPVGLMDDTGLHRLTPGEDTERSFLLQ